MSNTKILEKAKEFDTNIEAKRKVEEGRRNYKKFIMLYPFREHPENIDLLTPEKLYNPGAEDYFFHWIEHKLKNFGHLRIGSALPWEDARDKIDTFKELLKKTVDDSISIAEKIDSNWGSIKFFGGDKNIAKKIIWCYYPSEMIPIFKTKDLEHFASLLGLDFKKESLSTKGIEYDGLSPGQKFEVLNKLVIDYKDKFPEFKKWDNAFFMWFLYSHFPPERPPAPKPRGAPKPLQSLGLLFEPSNEQEVIYLFALFHRELGFPYILKISSEFPDAEVMNEKKESKKIEFELMASSFLQHGHDPSKCDYIVCWENDLEDETSRRLPEILALKDLLEE